MTVERSSCPACGSPVTVHTGQEGTSYMLPEDTEAEWGIVHRRTPTELHRGWMTEEQAREWVREWVEDGGRDNVWLLVRRDVSRWKPQA